MFWWCNFWYTGNREVISNRKEIGRLLLLNAGVWNRVSSRLNARRQTDRAIEHQAKNFNWVACPYDYISEYSHTRPHCWNGFTLALAINMFIGVNVDALAIGKWYRVERKPVVFFCWMQDSNPGSLEPTPQWTECQFYISHWHCGIVCDEKCSTSQCKPLSVLVKAYTFRIVHFCKSEVVQETTVRKQQFIH